MVSFVVVYEGKRVVIKAAPMVPLSNVAMEAATSLKLDNFSLSKCQLEHKKKSLNLDEMVRFTNLPDRAVLDMKLLTKAVAKKSQKVRIGLNVQDIPESIVESFETDTTLYGVLKILVAQEKLTEEILFSSPEIAYFGKTYPADDLDSITLGSLGLTGQSVRMQLRHTLSSGSHSNTLSSMFSFASSSSSSSSSSLSTPSSSSSGAAIIRSSSSSVAAGTSGANGENKKFDKSKPFTSMYRAMFGKKDDKEGEGNNIINDNINNSTNDNNNDNGDEVSSYISKRPSDNVFASSKGYKLGDDTDHPPSNKSCEPTSVPKSTSDQLPKSETLSQYSSEVTKGDTNPALGSSSDISPTCTSSSPSSSIQSSSSATYITTTAAMDVEVAEEKAKPLPTKSDTEFDPFKSVITRVQTQPSRPAVSETDRKLEDLHKRRLQLQGDREDVDRKTTVQLPGTSPAISSAQSKMSSQNNDSDISDSKVLSMALKNSINKPSIEDAPLLTKAQRDLEKAKRERVYSTSLLKIRFPDKCLLLGYFHPQDTLSLVYEWIERSMNIPVPFELFSTPPRIVHKKDESRTLQELQFVPAALLNLTWTIGGPDSSEPGAYFTLDLLEIARGNNKSEMLVPQGQDLIGKKKEMTRTDSLSKATSNYSDSKGSGGDGNSSGASGASNKSKGGPKWLKL